jgi:adenylate cyclase
MLRQFLTRSFLALSAFASNPEDSEEMRIKKIIAITVGILAPFNWLPYGLLYFAFNERSAAFVCVSAIVLHMLILLHYSAFRNYDAIVYFFNVVFILSVISIHILLGGFAQSGMVMLFLFASPIYLIVAYKRRQGLLLFLATAAIFIIAAILEPYYLRTSNNLPQSVITALLVINCLIVATYMILGVYYFVWQNEILSRKVLVEQAKSESLLLNIFPKEIATILKNENRIIADQFESASILFADVVNFTPMSASMTPAELVELLNEVYSHFDALVEKYDLEKIKTIGDCYMVAAGVPRRRSDHAVVLTQLALDIRDFVSQHEFQGRRLQFRIGINSGSVIAGVIGRRKFAYDLWGDAVNTASRMESHGSGGFIQITENTHSLIQTDFNCEARGKVNVKGKGEINVWYVNNRLHRP